MEWDNNMMYLSDDEIKKLAVYLAYGSGIGVFVGMFKNNIPLYFSLGSVIAIVVAGVVSLSNKHKKNK
ncbi:hypothetical protein [Clostridium gasigenes]|uniref:hypothetical protein n=1 Tax=Clostridium gasigenes TaxID=94869 RepID=UPI001C0CED65|nr:hypothetical protein [Clostridium gasigenes]MBU3109257.1 hypothetical protein [Clostridium gasigenes]